MTGKEFTLLDGPPYANGKVHIGHAINKVCFINKNSSQYKFNFSRF